MTFECLFNSLLFRGLLVGMSNLSNRQFAASADFSSAPVGHVHAMWKRRHRDLEQERSFSTVCGVV
jgi:hypothetical protein